MPALFFFPVTMLRLCFLAVAWLVQIPVFIHGERLFSSRLTTEAEYDRIAAELLSSLKVAHSQRTTRMKREIAEETSISLVDDIGVYRLYSVTPVSELCYMPLYIRFLDIGNSTYAICITASTRQSSAEVAVGLYEERIWKPLYRWEVGSPTSLSAFYFNEHLYVLVADTDNAKGTDLIKINLANGVKTKEYEVNSKYVTSISVWRMKVDGKLHMALANSFGRKDAADLSSEVYVYVWKDTYFDRYATFQAYDVADIEPFHIHGDAYLAVANYRRGKDNFQVDSEILKYDLDRNVWLSHQKIRTYGASDWEFFSLGPGLGQEFFLVVANKYPDISEAKSVIYKFVNDKFVPFQCLPTYGATSVAALTIDSTFLLAVANFNDFVHLYQYDGWQFVKSMQYSHGTMSNGVKHLTFHTVKQNGAEVPVLGVSNPHYFRGYSVYKILFKYENKLQAWHNKSTEWCLRTLEHLEASSTDTVADLLNGIVLVDQTSPIVVNGNLNFKNGLGARTLKTSQIKVTNSQEVFDNSFLTKLEDLQKRLHEIKLKMLEYANILEKALLIEGNQTISRHLEFQDAVFECQRQSCNFNNITTMILNGEDVADWENQLVFLNGEKPITGTIYAKEIRATDITVHGFVDGMDPQHLVTKSGSHEITAQKDFTTLLKAKDVEVNGLVDGVKISPSNVLLTTGLQNITGNLIFHDIDTSWLEIPGAVNGRSLSHFLDDLILSDKHYTVTGEKIFNDIVVNDLKLTPGSTINGVDFVDLWAHTLWKDGYQEITAPMQFSTVTLNKDLYAPAGINGILIPGPRVVDIKSPANVTATHNFLTSTSINRLEVLRSINGIGFVDQPGEARQLDIMLRSGDQMITGRKTFHTVHLDGNSLVDGKVDGVDLSELKETSLRRDASIVSNRTWTFKNLVIKGPLTVHGKIADIDINDVYERALKLHESDASQVIFNDTVYIEELECQDINGINVKEDLVLINEPQNVSGKKVFETIILEENSVVLGLINNLNISFLTDTFLKIGNQALRSKTFTGDVKVKNLTVFGSINGVPVDDFVTLTGPQIISNARMLSNVTFNEIEAKNIEIYGNVNSINLDEMMEDTLTYEGYQEIKGKKSVKGTIHVPDGHDLKSRYVNGVDFSELWNDAVWLDTPETISGIKTFANNVIFGSLIFKSTIDGVTEWDMKHKWMLKNVAQVIEGNATFVNGLSVQNLEVTGLLNNINVTHLNNTIVKTNEPAVIEGPVIFEGTLISNEAITLSGKVQGYDLSEEAILKSGNLLIAGEKTFLNDLVIEGDVTVDGLVDGISISDICEKTLLLSKEQNITHLTIKGEVTLLGGGTIDGNLAGVNLAKLQDIVITGDSGINITGRKTFQDLTIDGIVEIKGKFGGIDLQLLNQTYMSLTRDQEISGQVEFEELVVEGKLTAKNFNTRTNKVNDIDIKQMSERLLMKNGTQIVNTTYHFDEIIFDNDVLVAGRVNGLKIPDDLMLYNRTNYIQSPKIFEKTVSVLGDLTIEDGKLIQGIDISEWHKKSVLKDGGTFIIDGYKTFHNLSITDARVDGTINGISIAEDKVLMVYGNQVITGKKTVRGNVEIKGSLNINGLINGVDLDYLSRKTLQRNRNNSVSGLKYFKKPLTVTFLEAPTVAGIDVTALERKVNADFNFSSLQNKLIELEEITTGMQDAFSKQAVIFQYYELFQEFDIPTAYSWLHVFGEDCGELLLLSDNSSSMSHCSSIRLFNYDKIRDEFIVHPQELTTSYAVSVKSLLIHGRTHLFVANQNPTKFCESPIGSGSDNASGDIYLWTNATFLKIQTIELTSVINMMAFTDGSLACVIYMEFQDVKVYCSHNGEQFAFTEILHTKGGRKASIIQSDGQTILAIATEDVLNLRSRSFEEKKPVDIYFWNPVESRFSNPSQTILSTYAQSVMLMSHHDMLSSHIFLVIAEGRIPKIYNEPKLLIYRYEASIDKQFHKYQEIKDYGDLEWIVLETGELLFFALDSQMGEIKLYQYKGASGFVKVDKITSIGTVNIHAFIRHEDPSDSMNHYLALAGPRALMAQPSQGIDYAKILKSKFK
ncbi:uncharacterized protein LOC118190946 [Stegodyphus dumicola]|uniref:uncharacterized protein LOC118190946 n=1 Tax=Stegodyphus dumicola TaxID=202533 RepID=UPI0015AD700E|nr:uncharacterized protein LOC118190946 [Stegodyphus dumicola]